MEFLNWYQVKQSIGIKSFEKRYSSQLHLILLDGKPEILRLLFRNRPLKQAHGQDPSLVKAEQGQGQQH